MSNCHGCEYVVKYSQIPARWCDYFTPSKLNRNFPKPIKGCPKISEPEEPVNLGEFA